MRNTTVHSNQPRSQRGFVPAITMLAFLTALVPSTAFSQSLDGVWEGRGKCRTFNGGKIRYRRNNPLTLELRSFDVEFTINQRRITARVTATPISPNLFPGDIYRGVLSDFVDPALGGWMSSCLTAPDVHTTESPGGEIVQLEPTKSGKLKYRSFALDVLSNVVRRGAWDCRFLFKKISSAVPALPDGCP